MYNAIDYTDANETKRKWNIGPREEIDGGKPGGL